MRAPAKTAPIVSNDVGFLTMLAANRTIAAIAAVLLVATNAGWARAQDVPADTLIKLERTSCFGECPIYSVSIDATGTVTYEGKQFVRVRGRQTDRVPVSHVAALLAAAERIGFFQLKDRYRTIQNPDGTETFVTDLPTAFVTIARDGRSKRIEDYVGAPDGLRELERQIDETARTKRWIRIDEPTLRQLVREGWSPTAEERAELLGKALLHDDVPVVKALLELGADPNGGYGETPPLIRVHSAAAARALIDAGALVSVQTEHGLTPLGTATYLAPDVTEVFLKAGASADQSTSLGQTALWQAACRGNIGVVRLLLGAGADPARRANGMSAADCARQGKQAALNRRPSPLTGKPPFVEDFDAVIAALEQAIAKRKQRQLP